MNSYDIAKKHGMMNRGEVALLKACAMQLTEKPVVVNIGAGFGTSSAAILEERPSAFIFSVDKEARPEEQEGLIACGLNANRCIRLLGLSWDIGVFFPYEVELLFVDGSHEEGSVRKDIAVWLPKVVSNGFVLFHDYNHQKAPGVTIAVDELMKDHEVVGSHRYLIAYSIP